MRATAGAVLLLLAAVLMPSGSSTPGSRLASAASASELPAITHVGGSATAQNDREPDLLLPTAVEAGDRLLLVLTMNATSRTVSAPTGASGWTLEGDRSASTMRTLTWSKVADAGDAGLRVAIPLSARTKATLHVAAYRGVAEGLLTVASKGETTSGSVRTTPQVPSPQDAWVVSYWATKSSSVTSWTPAPEVTPRDAAANSGTGRIASLLADSGGPVPAGEQGGVAATSDASTTKATTWTVVLPVVGGSGNLPPAAHFSTSCSGLDCSFDGTGSTDPEGDLVDHAWSFGDGDTAVGPETQHSFEDNGSYDVTLTVTDGQGLSDSETQRVTVAAPGTIGPPTVTPDGETAPVLNSGDAADDPAVWVHPTDPALSLVIGNDKQGALEVYDLATGDRVQRLTTGTRFWGNVDVRHGVTIGGRTLDLVAAYNLGIRTFDVDAGTRRLVPVGDGGGNIVTDGGEGLCAHHSARTGQVHVYVITRAGRLRQYLLHDDDADGLVEGRLVRQFEVGSEAEGCVADDEAGALYVSEEKVGLWRYGAEPEDGSARTLVDAVGPTGNLVADAEGVAIADTGGGEGYLIVSAQNGASPADSYFAVYDRVTNAHLWSFSVEPGAVGDGCERTDGIAAQTGPLGPGYPRGVFVCQDNLNSEPEPGRQNFKLVSLDKILPAG